MTFTIHASKDGHLVQTLRLKPQAAVSKARSLNKAGWEVYITDVEGASFSPPMFGELLQPKTTQALHQTAQRLWLCRTTQPRCSVERNFFNASHPERMRRASG
jgi:hypothetical protein